MYMYVPIDECYNVSTIAKLNPESEVDNLAVSKAQQNATRKYKEKNYDRIELLVAAGHKEKIKAYAESKGESVNGLVNRLLKQEMGE